MFEAVQRFLESHQTLVIITGIVSVALSLVSLVIVPIAILNLPADHFIKPKNKAKKGMLGFRFLWYIVRNILGTVLFILGVILLVIPGPGWATIIVGVALLDLPLKHKLELKILSLPIVRTTIDHYRRKKNKPPLQFP